MSKHFITSWGDLGAHLGYQFNQRRDYPINSPCVGVNWRPIWIKNKGIVDNADIIFEYDSRTINLGFIATMWNNYFEVMFELQKLQWLNFSICYKLQLKLI